MNNEIKNIINRNNQLCENVDATLPAITESLAKTKFRCTTSALLSFIPKSGFVNSSILESCINSNVYSASILFRSMIEHSFRHLYIFTKTLNDNSDSVGEAYYHSLKSKEDLESFEKIRNYTSVVFPEKTKWSTKGENNKVIKETAKQFDIQNIFYYLIENNNSEKDDVVKGYKKDYLLGRLVEYTNMSSSVHGGPFGELALVEIRKDKSKLNIF